MLEAGDHSPASRNDDVGCQGAPHVDGAAREPLQQHVRQAEAVAIALEQRLTAQFSHGAW